MASSIINNPRNMRSIEQSSLSIINSRISFSVFSAFIVNGICIVDMVIISHIDGTMSDDLSFFSGLPTPKANVHIEAAPTRPFENIACFALSTAKNFFWKHNTVGSEASLKNGDVFWIHFAYPTDD